MSERRVETVERDGKRVIEIHLAPNEPTKGEMAETPNGYVFDVKGVKVQDGELWWSDGHVWFPEGITLHTPPETVDGVSVEDLRAVLDAAQALSGRSRPAMTLHEVSDLAAAAARLRKKIEGADQ